MVLVVDHRGVTRDSAELLRSTGFLNRLLHDVDGSGEDPVSLAVAVVKIDEVTDSEWREDVAMNGDDAKDWSQHFAGAHERAVTMMQEQVRRELEKLATDGPESLQGDRLSVVSRVLATLQVHPVSAPQYRLFHAANKIDPARIQSSEESHVPAFAQALRALAHEHHQRGLERAEVALRDFREHVRSSLLKAYCPTTADG